MARKTIKMNYYALVEDSSGNKYFISPADQDGLIKMYSYTVVLGSYNEVKFKLYDKISCDQLIENYKFIFPNVMRYDNNNNAESVVEGRNRFLIKDYFLEKDTNINKLIDRYGTTTAGGILRRYSDKCEIMVIDEEIRKCKYDKSADALTDQEKNAILFSKIPTRAKNALIRNGYTTLESVQKAIINDDFNGLRNVGLASIRIIVDVLRSLGYSVPEKYFIKSYHATTSSDLNVHIPYIKSNTSFYISKLDSDPEYSMIIRFYSLTPDGSTHKGVAMVMRGSNHIALYWISDPKYDIDILNKIRSGFTKYLKEEGYI